MATVSDADIARYAMDAGFSTIEAKTAVAIALAESAGNASATNHNSNGSTDYGLWQINSIHSSILASGQWSNPADNAKMAYQVFRDAGNRFTPWVTFSRGSYLAFMPRGTTAVNNALSGLKQDAKPLPIDPNTGDPLASLSGALNKLTDPAFWRRIVFAIAGGVLLIWSIMKMTGDNQVSEGTKALVKTVATKAVI